MTRAAHQNQTVKQARHTSAGSDDHRLTRKHVADRLGVSVFKVRSMEGKQLRPTVEGGVHYFDPDQVNTVARTMSPLHRGSRTRSDGEIAALAFRAFGDGKDLHDIVIELVITPERVRALYREWREPDLEDHEVRRRNRERTEKKRQEEREQQRRDEEEMKRWEQQLAKLTKPESQLLPQRSQHQEPVHSAEAVRLSIASPTFCLVRKNGTRRLQSLS